MDSTEPFHLSKLRAEFQMRRDRNAAYSLRSFARDLQLPISSLSEILNRKKGLTSQTAEKIGLRLSLPPIEKKLFVLSVKAIHAKSHRDREEARKLFQTLAKQKNRFQYLRTKELNDLHSWVSFAILELFELKGFRFEEHWMAEKLGLKISLIRQTLAEMLKQGWLQRVGNEIRPSYDQTEVESDTASGSVQRFHKSVLKKAGESIAKDPVSQREFNSVILAFQAEKLPEARAFIRKFQKEFIERFYSASSAKDSVYQMSTQLFRLDQETS